MHKHRSDQRLDHAVEKLTRPYRIEHKLRGATGGWRRVVTEHDALIEQLRAGGTVSLGSAGSAPSARMLADADAIEKLAELRADIELLWKLLTPGAVAAGILRQQVTLEDSLIGWYRLFVIHDTAHLVPPQLFTRSSQIVFGWVHTIEVRFDPPTVIESTAPCPECHQRWAQSTIGDRISAITYTIGRPLDTTRAACRVCGTTWRGPSEIAELVRQQKTP